MSADRTLPAWWSSTKSTSYWSFSITCHIFRISTTRSLWHGHVDEWRRADIRVSERLDVAARESRWRRNERVGAQWRAVDGGLGFRKVAWTKARQSLLPSLWRSCGCGWRGRSVWACPTRPMRRSGRRRGGTSWRSCFPATRWACARRGLCRRRRGRGGWRNLGGAAERLAAVYAPLRPDAVIRVRPASTRAVAAPTILTPWGEAGARLRGFVRERGLAARWGRAGLGDALERDWCGAAGLAGNLSAEAFFAVAE
jgi:hypothetical protein